MHAPSIAIDVALIPPKNVQELAIRMNRALIASSGDRAITLGSTRCIPHISLAMGSVSQEAIASFSEAIRDGARTLLPQMVNITGVTTVTTSSGTRVTGLDIERTAALQALHERCMGKVTEWSEGVDSGMLLCGDDEPVDEYIVNYIRNYPTHCAYSNFSPHITLGHGDKEALRMMGGFPLPFRYESLAVCHVGNHGVCKRILLSIDTEFQQ
jgi:2'-5' RNA ligase